MISEYFSSIGSTIEFFIGSLSLPGDAFEKLLREPNFEWLASEIFETAPFCSVNLERVFDKTLPKASLALAFLSSLVSDGFLWLADRADRDSC